MPDHLRAAAAGIAGIARNPYDQPSVSRLVRHMLADQDDRIGRGNIRVGDNNALEIRH